MRITQRFVKSGTTDGAGELSAAELTRLFENSGHCASKSAGGAVAGAQGAVDAVSSAVGDTIFGGAVRGAGNAGAEKLGRINNEEEVVATGRGARFFVYVE